MNKNYNKEIYKILQNPTKNNLKLLNKYHESDVADVFILLTKEERLNLYQKIDIEYISNMFTFLDDASEYINELDENKVEKIINQMDADDIIDILDDVDEDKRKEYFDLLDKDMQEDVKLINSYDENEIGSLMTTNFIVLNKNISIRQAMKNIIGLAPENDNINIIYFKNDDETYFGAITLKDLIIARENELLIDKIKTNYPVLYDIDKIEDVIETIKEYNLDSIPVLNKNHELIGILTSDDIIIALDEELKDDYGKMSALSGDFDINEKVFEGVKKRIPWLFTLLLLAFVVSSVISSFEEVLKELTIIVFFQSLVLDMAGNVGTQSLAVTIRVISEDLNKKICFKLLGKEIKVGIVNGIIVGFIAFLLVVLFLWLLKNNELNFSLQVGFIVFISLILSMCFSAFIGSFIPIVLKKLKIDPAVASGPFITTLNDLLAILIYYGIAAFLLL